MQLYFNQQVSRRYRLQTFQFIMLLLVSVNGNEKVNFLIQLTFQLIAICLEPGNQNIQSKCYLKIKKKKLTLQSSNPNFFYHHFSEEKRFGCVAVTSTRSWKMFDCRKRMPFICELKPSRPRRNKKFNQRCSLRRSNN